MSNYDGLLSHIQYTSTGTRSYRRTGSAWGWALVVGLCVGLLIGVSI